MNKLRQIIYRWIDARFLGGCSSYNSLEVRKSCRSKRQARQVFAKNNIPHARGETFFSPFKAVLFAKKYGFPLVVKPNVSGFSRGSYFPLTGYGQLLKASLMAKVWWPVGVVEQYLEGVNYRVVVVADGIMSVIRRYPPFVDGDGKSTIAELIDRENETRKSMGLLPVIHEIPKDAKISSYLKRKGLSFDTIPPGGERVRLFNRISLAPGGVVEIVDKKSLPPENVELFNRTLKLFSANILGIDAIFSEGIEKCWREQEVILLEVNSRPYLRMHDFPRYGQKEDLGPYYRKLDALDVGQKDIF